MTYRQKACGRSGGFTLVELAIVLMIIGLLIAGVLRGQEVLLNAQIAATVKQVQSYKGAVVTFRDTYDQMPGDMSTALNRIPNCATVPFCGNGNGNSVIGQLKVGIELMEMQTGAAQPQIETSYFWKHLALANLISGIDATSNPTRPEFGRSHPPAALGGGFMVSYGPHHYNTALTKQALWLVSTNTLSGTTAYLPNGGNPLSPIMAKRIDEKMDDGMPDEGDVHSPDNGTCDNNIGGGARVYLATSQKTCVLIYQIF